MLELHGWITLRESYKTNSEEENMKYILVLFRMVKLILLPLKMEI